MVRLQIMMDCLMAYISVTHISKINQSKLSASNLGYFIQDQKVRGHRCLANVGDTCG